MFVIFFHLHSSLQTQTVTVAFQCFLNHACSKSYSIEVAFKQQQTEKILFPHCAFQNKISINYLEGKKQNKPKQKKKSRSFIFSQAVFT